jgi:hypothetical protein
VGAPLPRFLAVSVPPPPTHTPHAGFAQEDLSAERIGSLAVAFHGNTSDWLDAYITDALDNKGIWKGNDAARSQV